MNGYIFTNYSTAPIIRGSQNLT